MRVIGYSITAQDVPSVILVAADLVAAAVDAIGRPSRDRWGSQAGVASRRDRGLHETED